MSYGLPDFLIDQPVIQNFTAGATFAYIGPVQGLDPLVAWGLKAVVVTNDTGVVVASSEIEDPTLTVSMVKASDFSTSGIWIITLLALAAVTATWATATAGISPILRFDLKFFDTAHPDPVIYSTSVWVTLRYPITP